MTKLSKELAEHLVGAYAKERNRIERTYEDEMKILEEKYEKELDSIRDLEIALEKNCPHEQFPERVVEDFDYHKREDWTKYYCSNCGKLLRRV